MMEYHENLAADLSRLCKRFLDSEKVTGDKITKTEKMILLKIDSNTNNNLFNRFLTKFNNLASLSLESKHHHQKTDAALLKINTTLDEHVETGLNLEKTLNGYIQDLQERQVAINKLIQISKKNLENAEKSIDERITEDEKRLSVLEKGL